MKNIKLLATTRFVSALLINYLFFLYFRFTRLFFNKTINQAEN